MSLVVVVVALSLSVFSASAKRVKFILISDLHLDIAYGTPQALNWQMSCTQSSALPYGMQGCDAPPLLVGSALHDALSPDRGAEYVLMMGDWARHGMDMQPQLMLPTFQNLSAEIARFNGNALPLPNFAGALGNNDFIPDYFFNVSAPSHPVVQQVTEVLYNSSLLSKEESKTFGKCGYYRREIAANLDVIVLNSLIWTTDLVPQLPPGVTDPCGQLEFLNASLVAAKQAGKKVIITSHIPPNLGLFEALTGDFEGSKYWHDEFLAAYEALTAKYSTIISVQLYGHTHEFSFLAKKSVGVPMLITPSITPFFGNNPSYFVATFDDTTWDLIDIVQRYFELSSTSWIDGLSMKTALGMPSEAALSNNDALFDAAVGVLANDTVWNSYQVLHAGGLALNVWPNGACDSACRKIVGCTMQYSTPNGVATCVSAPIVTPSSTPTDTPSATPTDTPSVTPSPTPSSSASPSPTPKPSPPQSFPWWIAAAVAGIVLLLIVVAGWARISKHQPIEREEIQSLTTEIEDDS